MADKGKKKTKIEDMPGKGKVKDSTARAVKGGVYADSGPGSGLTWSRQEIGETAGPSSVSDNTELGLKTKISF